MSLRVVDYQVRLFCGSYVVNQRVADRGKLARFLNFVGIILRTEWVVTLAVGVDAVENIVVIVPKPILLLHCLMQQLSVGLRNTRLLSVNSVCQKFCEDFVTFLRWNKPAGSQRLLGFSVKRFGRIKKIHKSQPMLLGNRLHRISI